MLATGITECPLCNGAGLVAFPHEDLDVVDLRREWLSQIDLRPGHGISSAAARERAR